jgi:large subunit ribosomal protein L9
MKIILLQNVNKIGKRGDVKEVSTGYARNFLIPKRLAIPATERAIFDLEKEKTSAQEKDFKEQKKSRQTAKKLEGLEIIIKAKAGDGGKLYGSVSEEQILEKIKEKGFDIERKSILIDKPLKTIGNHEVLAQLGQDFKAKIYIKIIQE